jgi:putative mRNA 3-end processing factor
MRADFHPHGIYLPEIELWLDGAGDCPNNWISHGHVDCAGEAQGRVLATAETLEMCGADSARSTATAYGQPLDFRGATLTAWPSSHMLGAAQLLAEYGGERLVYTGGIKLRAPLCGAETSIVPCDRLILEATFGLPIYRFIEREDARRRIVEFAAECLGAGITPVLLGHRLGLGQEIAHVLCEAAIPTAVEAPIARFLPLYERAGYAFSGWTPLEDDGAGGKAIVAGRGARGRREAAAKNIRVAYVSGWASLDNARARAGAEALIPYSGEADFGELTALVEASGARSVDLVRGHAEAFAHILRSRGLDARAAAMDGARGGGEAEG